MSNTPKIPPNAFKSAELEQALEQFVKTLDPTATADRVMSAVNEANDGIFPALRLPGELAATTGEMLTKGSAALKDFGNGIGEETEESVKNNEVLEGFAAVVGETAETATEFTGKLTAAWTSPAGHVIEGVGAGATGVVDGVEHLFRGQLGEAVDDIGHGVEGLCSELVTGGWEFAVGHVAAIAELVEGAGAISWEALEAVAEITGVSDDTQPEVLNIDFPEHEPIPNYVPEEEPPDNVSHQEDSSRPDVDSDDRGYDSDGDGARDMSLQTDEASAPVDTSQPGDESTYAGGQSFETADNGVADGSPQACMSMPDSDGAGDGADGG